MENVVCNRLVQQFITDVYKIKGLDKLHELRNSLLVFNQNTLVNREIIKIFDEIFNLNEIHDRSFKIEDER
jgi:hypothetical protein